MSINSAAFSNGETCFYHSDKIIITMSIKANKNQIKAINAENGAHLVIASAGSGKTYTIIQRSIALINKGLCKPGELLLLTFSRKAADELKKRIIAGLGNCGNDIVASTFHAFCLQYIIKQNMKQVTVLDEESSEKIIKQIVEKHVETFNGIPSSVMYKLALKNIQSINLPHDIYAAIKTIKDEYEQYKQVHNVIDFEDMINKSIDCLSKNISLRNTIHKTFKYVMVDEFQDTSENNFKLLKLLLPEENPNIFMVGDDWQSIYKFRDAKIEYIVNARKYFDNLTVHSLNSNYRSKKEIVKLSNRLIAKNRFRSRRWVKSVRGGGGKIYFVKVDSFEIEALIADTIAKQYDKKISIGVLYRNNWQGTFLQSRINTDDNVKFMTIHGAKGLEFDVVILCGVKDRLLPDPYTDIEEERRLMYVALTRAKNCLHILYHPAYSNPKPQFIEECESYV
ncbi:MAG TPA: ATP-dependent helicase [Spirochaetota bacterium]|nr:ATP-dependent helicase [Spirochaetota bacterium]HOM10186.1 ATP-dependent helicase [Spirochaetota bacterium]HPP48786.1 ATP-dependent helicase [Spirochaetota bacterium]